MPTTPGPSGLLFPLFKWTVYGLLSANIVLFLLNETATEALDSLAWVTLLLLFEWETRRLGLEPPGSWQTRALHLGRGLAYVLIVSSALEYSSAAFRAEFGSVDMWNAWTWIAISLLLEADVWFPHRYGHFAWIARNTAKGLLYGALFVYVVLWSLEGSWLDGYDASLWILCFFAIELNLFRFEALLDRRTNPAAAEA